MKIWFGFGSEHSSNIVIIGKFENAGEASKALSMLQEAKKIALDQFDIDQLESQELPEALLEFAQRTNFMTLRVPDLKELIYEFHPRVEESSLVITTDEYDVGSFVKVLVENGGNVEVYSAHNQRSPYGRQTYKG